MLFPLLGVLQHIPLILPFGFNDVSIKEKFRIEHLRYSGDALKISVTDNGVGIPEETLRQLRESLEQCESGENTGFQASGIGLLNIQKRIRFKFGKPYGISVFSEESKGTTAILYIPRRFEKC